MKSMGSLERACVVCKMNGSSKHLLEINAQGGEKDDKTDRRTKSVFERKI